MKRVILIAVALVILVTALVACEKEKNVYDIDKSYDSRTAAFYGHIKDNQFFWFEMELTSNNETYKFTQATNGSNVTTITDREGTARDSYEIAVVGTNGAVIHTIHLDDRKYDTTISDNYQKFLFDSENPDMYSDPNWSGEAEFEGTTYYAETFETASSEGGTITGYNKYYYDEGRLIAVEIAEKDVVTMVMKFIEYGIEIPEDIYINTPEGFSKGTFQVESVIDYNSMGWN